MFPIDLVFIYHKTGSYQVFGIKHVENNARPSNVEFIETENDITIKIKSFHGINSTVTIYYDVFGGLDVESD